MTSLKHYEHWKRSYNSPPDNLISDFYEPAYSLSIRYDRVACFWNSRVLGKLITGLDAFVANGGQMRLIVSPDNLSNEDLQAISDGEEQKKLFQRILLREIKREIPDDVIKDKLQLLTWMVANNVLEIKIGLCVREGKYTSLHDKVGIFQDSLGDFLAFSGSANETTNALKNNSESFLAFKSWANEEQLEYATETRTRFEYIWNGTNEDYHIWNASKWLAEQLENSWGSRPPRAPLTRQRSAPPILGPRIPEEIKLRDYQHDAISKWEAQGRKGILAMATGTGKTFTALAATVQLCKQQAKKNKPLLILVVVPQKELIQQWKREANKFGFSPVIKQSSLSTSDQNKLKSAFSRARMSFGANSEMVITTAQSLTPRQGETQTNEMQRLLAEHGNRPMLVIADEVHGLSENRREALPKFPEYRLGLSATPERYLDEEGTGALFEYFGPIAYEISIYEAIHELKVLVPYHYYFHIVELSHDEFLEYKLISRKIALAFADEDEDAQQRYIRERTRLTQHAENKVRQLRTLMAAGNAKKHSQLIYVAEGKNPHTGNPQTQEIENLLRNEFNMEVRPYTGETSPDDRLKYKELLKTKKINGLIAMKCLDEGVDIPSARIGIIMTSTTNPRQFIQRRGRILRRDPNDPKKIDAILHDFLVLPPKDYVNPRSGKSFSKKARPNITISEARLISNELSRACELSLASRNKESYYEIRRIGLDYGLLPKEHLWMQQNTNDRK